MARTLVVLPTFNRSNVLKLAVQSVLLQSDTDWQLLVMGDACTDDSHQVLAQYDDPRLQFFNRERNFGNMAIPINEGVALGLARWPDTKHIALLAHDDLWLPNHLAQMTYVLEHGADFAMCPYFECGGHGEMLLRHADAHRSLRHDIWLKPMTMSAWLFSTELWRRVGNWRAPSTIYDVPSADWRYRAWRLNARIRFAESPSLIVVNSVVHERSYLRRVDAEQVFWAQRLQAADLREQLTLAVLSRPPSPSSNGTPFLWRTLWAAPMPTLKRVLRSVRYRVGDLPRRIVRRVAPYLGTSPGTIDRWFAGDQRGSFVERLMRLRGLRD